MGSVHYPRRPPSGWSLHVRAVVVPSGGTVQPFVHRSGGPPLSPSAGPNFLELRKAEVQLPRIPIPRTPVNKDINAPTSRSTSRCPPPSGPLAQTYRTFRAARQTKPSPYRLSRPPERRPYAY